MPIARRNYLIHVHTAQQLYHRQRRLFIRMRIPTELFATACFLFLFVRPRPVLHEEYAYATILNLRWRDSMAFYQGINWTLPTCNGTGTSTIGSHSNLNSIGMSLSNDPCEWLHPSM